MQIGYHLSSEEHPPGALVRHAVAAEAAGFEHMSISDHFHPWGEDQGHSPSVWVVLGALLNATERASFTTTVTCPILRMHPALVAHAAATVAQLGPGRFELGVGTGERLNEHVLGQHWPPASIRQEMLAEAIEVIRDLWRGVLTSHDGTHFRVENAQIYDAPEQPPPIHVAASGADAAELAGTHGDGLVALAPDADMVARFRERAGADAPVIGMTHVCWADHADEALAVVRRWWTTAGLPGSLNAELPLPRFFDDASAAVSDDARRGAMVMGNDTGAYAEMIAAYRDAGFDRLHLHQVGPDQQGFLDAWRHELRDAA